MYLVKNIDQYNEKNVYFCPPIKNNIMNDGNFIRILYSNENFVLNGIYLCMSMYDVIIEKYYNKYKCIFNKELQKELVNKIKVIEEDLLKKVNITNKIPQYKISEQLKCGSIKIFTDFSQKNMLQNNNLHNYTFLLKISGIWETETQYGITYKFTKLDNP